MTTRALSKTIFALSSGSPPSAIAVIRLSGSESKNCLKRLTKKSRFRPRELFYAPLFDSSSRLLDRSMAVYMPGPHTFTGEDTVEFYVHGGRAVVNAVMEALKKMPNVDSAKAGEFTKRVFWTCLHTFTHLKLCFRAFFNGKMDLSQVEALGDLISAETERQRALALSQDNIAKLLRPLRERLLHLMARFEAAIDFADDVELDRSEHDAAVREILQALKAMRESARKGCLIKEGARVALVGRTNVGKSSLINKLAEREVAIVSSISGTTRDSLEARIQLNALPVVVTDTAGIRESDCELETEGIRRSIRRAQEANVVLLVVDLSRCGTLNNEVEYLLKQIGELNASTAVTVVLNKADLWKGNEGDLVLDNKYSDFSVVRTSCKTDSGVSFLVESMSKTLGDLAGEESSADGVVLSRFRQIQLIDEATEELEEFEFADDGAIAAQHLRNCADLIGEVAGAIVNEQILDSIFSQFCIGKTFLMSTTEEIVMAKKDLRKAIAKLLESVDAETIEKETNAVTTKVLESDWFRKSQRISVFVNTMGEIETDAIILKALELQKDVFIPRFKRGQKLMEMLRLQSKDDFEKLDTALWGIRQHHPDLSPPCYKETGPLDVVIMPGVAFTNVGLRLGHGKGFYDRFLHEHEALFGALPRTVALALNAQMVDEVPVEPHDVQLDDVYRAH
ncbi:hypothetical protein QR680_009677 [Steinernema hermaphroditum]|uniref:TrmE-type G domain-containing protein n=1 Tax=Steinernema hermaphroditum TaxID=289476 RepID=A0AA39M9B8_9BILA|nr:hypothetical protein QR680_009677 [Steinernema hermaphroditum]